MIRFSIVALVISAFVLQTGAAGAQTAVNRAGVQTQIIANEKAINDAFVKNDLKTFHFHQESVAMAMPAPAPKPAAAPAKK
jgi:hypothetical protein